LWGRVYWRKKNDVRHLGDLFLIFTYYGLGPPTQQGESKMLRFYIFYWDAASPV
jgi:hypothetical protein